MTADPIKLARVRDEIRAAKHRLIGLTKVMEYISMISMNAKDKRVLEEYLTELRNSATDQYDLAVKSEDSITQEQGN